MILNNTKTLPSSIVIPKTIQNMAKSIQLLSTRLLIPFLDKLFRTPVNFQTPEREKTMWESAQKKRVKITKLDKEIDVLSYGFSTKKVLLIHGWSGRSTQLFMIADKLLEKGFMIISFDATAHGKSEGKKSSMLEFIDAIQQIDTDFGPFNAAVGHSLGGVALYNTANALQLKNFVTIGAGNKISMIISRFVKNLGLKPKIAIKLQDYYGNLFQKNIDSFSSASQAKNIKIPVLVVHDSQDNDVPVSCAQDIRQNLEKGSLLITQGLGHTKILRDKDTMSRVVNFIQKNQ